MRTDPQIITEVELQNLFDAITPENSWNEKSKRHMYREWLKPAILLFLYTGGRRDDVWLLKWEDRKENYLRIPNHKLNRKAKEEIDFRPLYITKDLAKILLELGGDGEGYIICPERENREQVKNECSKAFTHFWNKSGNKNKRELRHLRKTFATRIKILLGDKAKGLKLNTDQVQVDHYLSQLELQKELADITMFDVRY